jgi:hypothetical protein
LNFAAPSCQCGVGIVFASDGQGGLLVKGFVPRSTAQNGVIQEGDLLLQVSYIFPDGMHVSSTCYAHNYSQEQHANLAHNKVVKKHHSSTTNFVKICSVLKTSSGMPLPETQVDGTDVQRWPVSEIAPLMLGPPGENACM